MHPLVRGAAAAALLAALGSFEGAPPPSAQAAASGALPSGATSPGAPCGPRSIPEGSSCVPLPLPGAPLDAMAPPAMGGDSPGRGAGALSMAGSEPIPRRPDRPAEPTAYLYPLGGAEAPPVILSGFGVERPIGAPSGARAPGAPRGAELAATRGERVVALSLAHQEGPTEVHFVGELFGITVATSHALREAGRLRRVLVLHGHLERPAPGVAAGARLANGDLLGYAGDSGNPGVVLLRLEARQLREGVALETLGPKRLVDDSVTIPCDLRNVLPLREPDQGASL